MFTCRVRTLVLIVALASVLFGSIAAIPPNRAEAGTNGQQLQIYYNISNSDCPVRVDVVGYNQNGVYTSWNDRGAASCDTWYIQTAGYWWKGRVWVQVQYRRLGNGYTVPTTHDSNYYKVCLPGARNCRG
jgi:hypothetical protein